MALPPPNIPVLLKHNTLGVFKSKNVKGSGKERFDNAFNIARYQLAKYGYLTRDSAEGSIDKIQLTGKGRTKDTEKRRSSGSVMKQREFDRLWDKFDESQDGGD